MLNTSISRLGSRNQIMKWMIFACMCEAIAVVTLVAVCIFASAPSRVSRMPVVCVNEVELTSSPSYLRVVTCRAFGGRSDSFSAGPGLYIGSGWTPAEIASTQFAGMKEAVALARDRRLFPPANTDIDLSVASWNRVIPGANREYKIVVNRVGWPFEALTCTSYENVLGNGLEEPDGGLRLTAIPWTCGPWVVPLTPIWWAIVADLLILGAMWAIWVLSIRILRTAWRLSNGYCTSCGYELAMLVRCPECGAIADSSIVSRAGRVVAGAGLRARKWLREHV